MALTSRVIARSSVSQAILPTGVGKTAVINALPFAVPSGRVLIIVPTMQIRRQVATSFNTLRLLKHLRVLPGETKPPRVKSVLRRIRTAAEWEALEGYDVVVATPNCVSSAYSNTAPPPPNFFDLLVIDEAHHAAARTWNQIIDDLSPAPAVLLTATPFRRDKRRLPGEIAYSYPLREAIADGVYSPIEFLPVARVDGEEPDVTLARFAKSRLERPRHVRFGSQLLVRTDRVIEAQRLQRIYEAEGINLPVLTGDIASADADRIVDDLRSGTAMGVIAVGVLTEGFDLPKLKIAAYHRKHQSFAATLQFVGRLARTDDDLLLQPELLAFPDDLGEETAELYREDASWPALLPEIADAAVERERESRDYLSNFTGQPKAFSITAVEPRHRVQIFELGGAMVDFTQRPENVLHSPVVEHFVDEELSLAALVTQEIVHPDWLRSTALDTVEYGLHVLCVAQGAYLFVQTSSEAATNALLAHYSLAGVAKVAPEKINAALYTFPITDYSMLGLRNASPNASTGYSYKTVAGYSASKGVTLVDETTTSAGHLSARYLDGNLTTSVGSSLESAKFWESSRGSLFDFRDWCVQLVPRLDAAPTSGAPPALNVSIRSKLLSYPRERVFAVVLPPELFEGELHAGTLRRSLADCNFIGRSIATRVVVAAIVDGHLVATVSIDLDGLATPGHRDGQIELDGSTFSMAEAFNNFPPTIFFANATSAFMGTSSKLPSHLATLSQGSVSAWSWDDVDIRRESKPPRVGFSKNVQERALEHFIAVEKDALLIVDDGANEIADVIAIRRAGPRQVGVSFVHCKYSTEDTPGLRLLDLELVLSQVSRSVRWTLPATLVPRLRQRLLDDPKRLRRGTTAAVEELLTLLASGTAMPTYCFYAVQPGLLMKDFFTWPNGHGNTLATICANWCGQFGADFVLCGS